MYSCSVHYCLCTSTGHSYIKWWWLYQNWFISTVQHLEADNKVWISGGLLLTKIFCEIFIFIWICYFFYKFVWWLNYKTGKMWKKCFLIKVFYWGWPVLCLPRVSFLIKGLLSLIKPPLHILSLVFILIITYLIKVLHWLCWN